MIQIEIIKKGILTTLQDAGRKGYAFYAIPRSGVMDVTSANTANLIVGNPLNNPCLECHMLAPTLRFNHDAIIALAGADMAWHINGQNVSRFSKIAITKNSILSGKAARYGMRAYIAIRGIPKTKYHLGSCSSYPYARLGANKGQYFSNEDILEWLDDGNRIQDTRVEKPIEQDLELPFIRIKKGPEFSYLHDDSAYNLINDLFRILPNSNRMGARLKGPVLNASKSLNSSKGILPGMIQLLPSGQLIVILNDGQTTGGYPRIAYIAGEDYNRFNQIKFNTPFQFNFISD